METILCGLVVISFYTSWHLKKPFESISYFPQLRRTKGIFTPFNDFTARRENTDILFSCITSPWPTSDFSTMALDSSMPTNNVLKALCHFRYS